MPKVLVDKLEQLLMRKIPGSGNHEIIGPVDALVIILDSLPLKALQRFRRAEDRASERMIGVELFGKNLEDQIIRRVFDHFDLFENDVALFLDLRRIEGRRGD